MDSQRLAALVQQKNASPRASAHLAVLGKTAAAAWGSGKFASLTDAVVDTVRSEALGPEQVQRVVEFANHTAFDSEFKRASRVRIVDFSAGPADPVSVLNRLNEAPKTAQDNGSLDYIGAPPSGTRASRLELIKAAFKTEGSSYEVDNPMSTMSAARMDLDQAYDDKTAEISRLEFEYERFQDRFYQEVKQAAAGGVSLGEVVRCIHPDVIDAEFCKMAMAKVARRLVDERVIHSTKLASSYQHVGSGGIRNANHPINVSFRGMQGTLAKLGAARKVRDEIGQGVSVLNTFLNNPGKFAEAAKGLIPAVTGLAEKASVPAGNAARAVGKALMGPGDFAEMAGQIAETGTRYAPHAAAAYGVHKATQTPVGQRILNMLAGGNNTTQLPPEYYGYLPTRHHMSALQDWAASYDKRSGTKVADALVHGVNALGQGVGTAVAAGALTAAGMAAAHIYDAATKTRDFRAMLASPFNEDLHELYRNDPKKFTAGFTSFRNVSPDLSKDPMTAGHYLRRMMTYADRDPGMAAGPILESMQFAGKHPSALSEIAHSGGEAAGKAYMEAQGEQARQRLQDQDFKQKVKLEGIKHEFGMQGGEQQHNRALLLATFQANLRAQEAKGNQEIDPATGEPTKAVFRDWYNKTMSEAMAPGAGLPAQERATKAVTGVHDDAFVRHHIYGQVGRARTGFGVNAKHPYEGAFMVGRGQKP